MATIQEDNTLSSCAELDELKAHHDEAFLYIASGIEHEENGNGVFAKEAYLKGLQKLEQALAIRCDRPHCVGPKWDAARKMQQKMRRNLSEMQVRLTELTTQLTDEQKAERPPTYDEACSAKNRAMVLNFGEPAKTLNRSESCNSVIVEELFSIPSGVQVFYVSAEGKVSTPSEPAPLSIYKFLNLETPTSPTVETPPAWLQIGSWTFPLVPGHSPVLHSGYGAYLFPDATAPQPGAAIGVVLPSTVDATTINIFENFMMELTALKVEDQVVLPELGREERTSRKISGAVVIGAEYISSGITKGAEVTGKLVQLGATKLKQRLTPEQPVTVNPRLQEGIKFLRGTSGAVRKVSGFVVTKLGEVTVALGKSLAPHVQKAGTHLLGASGIATDSVDSARKLDDVMIVAAGGLQGFSTIYLSLEQAAKNLASCLGNETVQVVSHKYGSEAGVAVDNAVNSIGNLALTAHNVSNLGVKSIAKRTAKDTGKAVLHEYVKK